jgi:hypothetical protein
MSKEEFKEKMLSDLKERKTRKFKTELDANMYHKETVYRMKRKYGIR